MEKKYFVESTAGEKYHALQTTRLMVGQNHAQQQQMMFEYYEIQLAAREYQEDQCAEEKQSK